MDSQALYDPVFLGIFFVLGYKKLFSNTPNGLGSVFLLVALSYAAAELAKVAFFNAPEPAPPTAETEGAAAGTAAVSAAAARLARRALERLSVPPEVVDAASRVFQ